MRRPRKRSRTPGLAYIATSKNPALRNAHSPSTSSATLPVERSCLSQFNSSMQPERYLQRIRYEGPLEPTLEVLRELHRAHMLSVPFENLDIPAKRPIVLQTPRLLHK